MVLKNNNDIIDKIVIDSREVISNCLFIPIIGEKYDGHIFMEEAYVNGCRNFLCDINHEFYKDDINLVKVVDNTKALCDIAKGYKDRYDIPFIAITGSVGKTSTKDIISGVLSERYNLLKTQGNLNNNIGLSKTLFDLDSSKEIAVIEMGMDAKGQIDYLSNLVNPDIAVITNIGMSHIMNFDDGAQGIYEAKMEITNGLKKNGTLIVNGDDKFLGKLKDTDSYRIIKCGFGFNNDVYCKSYEINEDGISFVCVYDNEEYSFCLNSIAKHNILSAMFGVVIGLKYGLSYEEIKRGLLNFELSSNRLDIITTDKYTIINDTYNASYESVLSAIEVINSFPLRKILILGDILELGDYSEMVHKKIGENIRCDILITIGNYSKYIGESAIINGFDDDRWYHFLTRDSFYDSIENILMEDDVILVKASRNLRFDEIVEKLTR